MDPELGPPLWIPRHPFPLWTQLSLLSATAGCPWTWTLGPTGNPSCPGELLVSTAADVEMQAVFALGLFSFHGKQNKTNTGACTRHTRAENRTLTLTPQP